MASATPTTTALTTEAEHLTITSAELATWSSRSGVAPLVLDVRSAAEYDGRVLAAEGDRLDSSKVIATID